MDVIRGSCVVQPVFKIVFVKTPEIHLLKEYANAVDKILENRHPFAFLTLDPVPRAF